MSTPLDEKRRREKTSSLRPHGQQGKQKSKLRKNCASSTSSRQRNGRAFKELNSGSFASRAPSSSRSCLETTSELISMSWHGKLLSVIRLRPGTRSLRKSGPLGGKLQVQKVASADRLRGSSMPKGVRPTVMRKARGFLCSTLAAWKGQRMPQKMPSD